jgi:hypothetical protein
MSTTAGNQAIPMMIQGVGGSGALTFIYPAAVMTNALPTSSTVITGTNSEVTAAVTSSNSEPTVSLSAANMASFAAEVIKVAPQVNTTVLSPSGDSVTSPGASINRKRRNIVLHKEMIDISELAAAAATSSIHSAITNQIILGIKTEVSTGVRGQDRGQR